MLVLDSDPETYQSFSIELIPRHLILQLTTCEEVEIHFISDDALQSHWAPAVDLNAVSEFDPNLPYQIPKLRTFRDPRWKSIVGMSVYKSPVQMANIESGFMEMTTAPTQLCDAEKKLFLCGPLICL